MEPRETAESLRADEFRVELDAGDEGESRAGMGLSTDSAEVLEEIRETLSRKSSAVEVALAAHEDAEKSAASPAADAEQQEAAGGGSHRARFQRRFFALIVATLRAAAAASGDERDAMLAQLATHLGARIEAKVIAYFLADHSIRLGQRYGNRHYFNLAAQGFGERPELYDLWDLEPTVSSLRSNKVFHEIYALLFHSWVFLPGTATVKSLNLVLSGAAELFLRDLNTKTFVFRPIYQVMRRVISNHSMWSGPVRPILMDLWKLYASYSFFYEKESIYILYNHKQFHLQLLLESAQEQSKTLVLRDGNYENVELNDAFARVILDQLPSVKSEAVLIRYLRFMAELFGRLGFSPKVALTLQSELYARSKPGNPYYLPDNARRAAADALAAIFPRGRKIRRIIALLFRFSQPYYVVRSFILFIWMCIMSILSWRWRGNKDKMIKKA